MNIYKIGNTVLQIINNTTINIDLFLSIFHSDMNANYKIYIDYKEEYESYDEPYFYDDRLFVYKTVDNECLELRRYLHPITKTPLATTRIYQTYSKTCFHQILKDDEVRNFLYVMSLGLDKIIYIHNSYILHSSSILLDNHMVLFSAPSGTGKSTQADLWKKYRNVKIINGDRNLIYNQDSSFYGQGWVLSGSSEYRENISVPIKCIVLLEKGPVNKIERVSGFKAINKLYREVIVNQWDKDYVESVFVLLQELIEKVPILYYQCTKEEDAVNELERYLNEMRDE